MLILTRRIGESIIIGDNIVINVLGVRGLQVRLGIEAPREVSVHREEIYQRILEEQDTDGGKGGDAGNMVITTNSIEEVAE